MKLLRYGLCALLLGLVGVSPAAAQFNNVGTSAANFLKIPVGPRGTAVGGAYTALTNDATSLYWNVAGMTGVPNNEVTLTTNVWLLDLRHDYLGAVFSVGDFDRIGISISYLSYGEAMKVTTPAQPRGTGVEFTAYDVAVGLGYARQLTDRFSAGAQIKFIRESISQSAASGVAFDLGLIFQSEWNDLRIGAAITNFGPDMQMTGDDLRTKLDPHLTTGSNPDDVPLFLETVNYSLPIQFQVGIALTPMKSESVALTTMLDVRDARDFNQEIRLGGELLLMNTLYLRGGANLIVVEGSFFGGGDDVIIEGEDDPNNTNVGVQYRNPTTITRSDLRDGQAVFNVGAGLDFYLPNSRTHLNFDYAYSRMQYLEDVHRLGVRFQF